MKHSQIPLILLLALLLLTINLGCGSGPKQVVDETQGIDTTTAIPEDTVNEEETDEPQGIIKESQFETVYFDFDKSSLRSDSKSGLDSNYDLLMQFPDVMVKIEGHCDERGTSEYNFALGEKRALTVREHLMRLGVSGDRLVTISYGEESPADFGHNEAAWSKNRRCQFAQSRAL